MPFGSMAGAANSAYTRVHAKDTAPAPGTGFCADDEGGTGRPPVVVPTARRRSPVGVLRRHGQPIRRSALSLDHLPARNDHRRSPVGPAVARVADNWRRARAARGHAARLRGCLTRYG